jgi:hypothetical protein
MAKQSTSQHDTMERVMHAFKEGELETGSGKAVKSRRQAVAIGLSEAGASDQQSPAENKRASQTKTRDSDQDGKTKAQLYEDAKRKSVPGRSRMSKNELAKAVG